MGGGPDGEPPACFPPGAAVEGPGGEALELGGAALGDRVLAARPASAAGAALDEVLAPSTLSLGSGAAYGGIR